MGKIRIGIDGFNLAMPNGTGIATYGLVLARVLATMGHPVDGVFGLAAHGDPLLREVSFFDRLVRQEPPSFRRSRWRKIRDQFGAARGVRAIDVPTTGKVERRAFADRLPAFDRLVTSPHLFELAHRHLRLTGRFLELAMDDPPEVMHWTYPVPVELAGARNIYTLHDLVPLRLPFTTLDDKGFYYDLVRKCAERAAQICTVSEASRADIIDLLGVPAERVTNTYQASPTPAGILAEDPAEAAGAIEAIFGLPHRGYFLFFGAIEPKKNVGRLIEAYLSSRSDTPLVIVGGRAWQSEEELKLIAGGGFGGRSGRIVQLGYLPRALLLRLIRGARAVTFPSLYEGFGLPVLEAMQLGTPVLTSETGALGEVAGGAALAVDPYSVPAITQAIRALDADGDLRVELAARGETQARAFSEERYRDRLNGLYARAVA